MSYQLNLPTNRFVISVLSQMFASPNSLLGLVLELFSHGAMSYVKFKYFGLNL